MRQQLVAAFCFELCCLIVGEFFSSLPSWAVCAEWEGDGGVERFLRSCAVKMVINDGGVHLTYHQSRAELGPMPSWVVWMVTGESLVSLWGVAGDRERVRPLF